MRFVLASQSPARLATLRRAGLDPEVVVSGVDESALTAPTPAELTLVLAAAKLDAVAPLIEGPAVVLACDSLLEYEGEAHGKPGSADVAAQRWRTMRGQSGILHTGHALACPSGTFTEVVSTVVHFSDVTDEEIDIYAATGEPSAVAGAFTLDGLGGWFVSGIEGDPHNVVGVSLPTLRRMVRSAGLALADLGYPQQRATG